MKVLVTGSAGFIGFHVAKRLLERGDTVVGIDNINEYYDVNLKYARLAESGISREAEHWNTRVQSMRYPEYAFVRMNLEDHEGLMRLFKKEKFDRVVHLAAQAGVRYSLENPYSYIESNIVGFLDILEVCRHKNVEHLVYASSSSVYGSNSKTPFSTDDSVDHPISLYAATKKSDELMAHAYSHLFGLPTTGLRFFTVYGPWGRPDMALFIFAKAILENKPIKLFNNGNMVRDFTYIDDIVEGVVRTLDTISKPCEPPDIAPSRSSTAPYRVYNIGNGTPVELGTCIALLERYLGKEVKKELYPMQAGDVPRTEADVTDLVKDIGYRPSTKVEEGIKRFVEWFVGYYTP